VRPNESAAKNTLAVRNQALAREMYEKPIAPLERAKKVQRGVSLFRGIYLSSKDLETIYE
jgi:hypothetical protein